MSFEGAISSLGATRALDGSIDRVPDPPPELWTVLAFLQAKCEVENVEIISVFEVRGQHSRSRHTGLACALIRPRAGC